MTDYDALCARLRETLPVCPFDRRSPDYWTTPDDKPCVVCLGVNEPDAPNLCRGADTRCMAEAADAIAALVAREAQRQQQLDDYIARCDADLKIHIERAEAAFNEGVEAAAALCDANGGCSAGFISDDLRALKRPTAGAPADSSA